MGHLFHTLYGSGNTVEEGHKEWKNLRMEWHMATSGYDATIVYISAIGQDLHKIGHNIYHGRGEAHDY